MPEVEQFANLKDNVRTLERKLVALEQDQKNLEDQKAEVIGKIKATGIDPRNIDDELVNLNKELEKYAKEAEDLIKLVQ